MSQWRECKLGEVVEVINGYAFKSEDFANMGIPVIKIKNVAAGRLDMSEYQCYPLELTSNIEKVVINKNDILIAMTGSHIAQPSSMVGKVARYNLIHKALLNQRVGKIISKDLKRLDEDYIYYFFKQDEITYELALSAGGSANQANISATQIKELDILLPSLPEQKAIAEVLASLDEKIDLLNRQNKTLEELAQSYFRQWFVVEAREDWEETTLSQHCQVFRGLSYKGDGLSDALSGIPMHNLNSVFEGGGYKHEGIKYYSGKYQERHIAKSGDIIVANTEQGHEFRLIGFPARIPKAYSDDGIFSQHLYRVAVNPTSIITSEFIYYLLMLPSVREQIIGATNGSTVNMLAIEGLQRPQFKIPPLNGIQRFTKLAQDVWEKTNLNHEQIRTLIALRDTLLPKLITGEVRVKM